MGRDLIFSFLTLFVALDSACSDSAPTADADMADASLEATDAGDSAARDATVSDASTSDASTDASLPDAATDASAPDASTSMTETCATGAVTCTKPSFCPPRYSAGDTSSPHEHPQGTYTIVLKFMEGSHVRLRNGTLAIDEATMLAEDPGLLCCVSLDVCQAKLALGEVVSLLKAADLEVGPTFSRDPALLDMERASTRATSGEYLSDLNLYYRLPVPKVDAGRVLERLRASAVIDVAYLQPAPSLP